MVKIQNTSGNNILIFAFYICSSPELLLVLASESIWECGRDILLTEDGRDPARDILLAIKEFNVSLIAV